MNPCEEYLERLSAFVDGELSDEERNETEQHLGECAACRQYLAELYALREALQAETTAPQGVSDAVLRRVREEKKRGGRWRGLLAACAVLVMVFTLPQAMRALPGRSDTVAETEELPNTFDYKMMVQSAAGPQVAEDADSDLARGGSVSEFAMTFNASAQADTEDESVIGGADAPTEIYVAPEENRARSLLATVLVPMALGTLLFTLTKKRGFLYGGACGAVIWLDRAVKWDICARLSEGESAPLWPSVVRLTRVHNFGAAWSSLNGARWLLVAITAVGIGVLVWLLARIVRHPLGAWALAVVIGGGIGNLIDRIAYGYVVDMLDLTFMRYPVFNVADCFVVVGTILAVIYYLAFYEKSDAGNWRQSHANDPSASVGK